MPWAALREALSAFVRDDPWEPVEITTESYQPEPECYVCGRTQPRLRGERVLDTAHDADCQWVSGRAALAAHPTPPPPLDVERLREVQERLLDALASLKQITEAVRGDGHIPLWANEARRSLHACLGNRVFDGLRTLAVLPAATPSPDAGELRDSERMRLILWAGHGHGPALYGDDGEMQCSLCGVDYKRSPFAGVLAVALNPPPLRAALLEKAPAGEPDYTDDPNDEYPFVAGVNVVDPLS